MSKYGDMYGLSFLQTDAEYRAWCERVEKEANRFYSTYGGGDGV